VNQWEQRETTLANHHDIFFKTALKEKERASDFLDHVLPVEIRRDIDFSTLSMENTSYVDDSLAEHFSDLVYSCLFGQSKIKIALLFEHKSSPDKELPYQLMKYMVQIWGADSLQKQTFTPVLPIVFYHGKKRWKPARLNSCFKNPPSSLMPYIPDFNYLFVDLSDYSDEAIKGEMFKLASLKISMLILKHIFEPDTLETELRNFFEIGRRYFEDRAGLDFLKSIITYIFKATEIESIKIVDAIRPVTKEGGDIAMTTAEKLRQEGHQEGHQEGRHEGRQEGRQEGLYAALQTMKKNGTTDATIANLMNMDLDLIKKILNKEQVEIPIHFLS
jgi:predicted transposase/invertase (TIGR01784 family)